MKFISYTFLAMFVPIAVLAAGNSELMKQKKSRVFLLNEELLMTLGEIEGDANISFSGKVVRGRDGKLQIKIDGIHDIVPYSTTRSITERTKIKYISFEEMLGKPAPEKQEKMTEKTRKPSTSSNFYGGGSVN